MVYNDDLGTILSWGSARSGITYCQSLPGVVKEEELWCIDQVRNDERRVWRNREATDFNYLIHHTEEFQFDLNTMWSHWKAFIWEKKKRVGYVLEKPCRSGLVYSSRLCADSLHLWIKHLLFEKAQWFLTWFCWAWAEIQYLMRLKWKWPIRRPEVLE